MPRREARAHRELFLALEGAYVSNPVVGHEERMGLPYWFKASDNAFRDGNGDVLIPVVFENSPRRVGCQAGYARIPGFVRSVEIPGKCR